MITGFNTDVEHDGVVYHVQTEDKGLKSPLILSLVYVGGTILASKRTPYEDLIKKGYDEKVLSERLNRQHKLICAAIHAGRIEDLKRQTGRDAGGRAKAPDQPQPRPPQTEPIQTGPLQPEPPAETAPPEPPPSVAPQPPAPPAPDMILVRNAEDEPAPVTREKEPPPRAAAPPFEEVAPPPQHAPAPPVTEHVDYSRVVDYYGSISQVEELQVSFVDEKKFVAGEFVKIHVHVGGGDDGRENVAGAAVTLKVLGSSFRPLIFTEKTGADGVATFYTMLPYFTSGRAAILVSATSDGHRAELRRIIHQA